ncbi:MAG TPA: polymer-forming cytoskeletal protein [Pyrinomonadaceae bacterium]|nr:polymer-forming cytoskeletal protein [Pyrinomonadaceae bacterium]
MFRPGRNPKEQTHADDTADHTPQTPAHGSYNASTPSSAQPAAGGATVTEAYQQSVHTPTTSRAVTESESLARDIKEGTLTGFVGNGTTLQGEASFKGMLRVDGHLSGRVSSDDGTLIVSTNGRVDANVEVAVAQIYGTVNGDITATKRIEMGRVAKVTGNIETPALVIEQGAIFEGSCRMSQLKEALDKQERAASAPSASSSSASANSSSSSSRASSAPAKSASGDGAASGAAAGSPASSEVTT